MKDSLLPDRPRRRPGGVAYARIRLAALLRPPVTVYEAPADVVRDRDVPVTVRDGTVLRVNVYRPAGPGPFPVIMSAHPYRKDALPRRTRRGWSLNAQYRIMNQPAPLRISDLTGWEAPDPAWWAGHGYAVVNADTRGAGTSQGTGSLMSDAEAQDVYDLIEWAGTQPWSNGAVGMLGVSYLAISQYKAAALQPPHLKAICPWEGFTDVYRDFMTNGGIVEQGFSRIWQAATKHGARLHGDMAKERPLHPLRDEWWQAMTPDLTRIRVPMLVCGSFSDGNLHSRGSFRAFEQTGSTDRFLHTHRGPKWATFYSPDALYTQLGFFDRYLRGHDVPPPPPVRLEVRESRTTIAEIRAEQEWPLARTHWRDLHLGPDGTLSTATPAPGAAELDLRRDCAAFTTTFTQDTELTGPMNLRLWASLRGADDANLFIGVEKWTGSRWVPFEGSWGYGRNRVTTGRQRLSLRQLDTTASAPHRPVHTFLTPQPLSPGEAVAVQIPLVESSTLFRAGETLRLLVSGRELERRNPLNGQFPSHYPRSRGGYCTLHWGADHPSALEVPVIPPR
ncbi:CocE/NonD family hydrolase [Streptacidiphilus sp. PB12-B1b]|nr:CocE/NonD family hydrolase [Streptacidiphilus sp. PB12-B1b]